MRSIFSCIIAAATLLAASLSSLAQSFEVRDGEFLRDGKPVQIIGGEMHYARIPHEYWRHRIRMAKSMGINTISTYVFWNAHEKERGKWDFSGDLDLASFIRICGEEGMMVLLRPGPYVCAEWDYGGLPWWLQNIPEMAVRQDNEPFLEATAAYLDRLYDEVGDLLCTRGGPIVMVQVENEFGSFYRKFNSVTKQGHRRYMNAIRDLIMEAGFDVPLYTVDGSLESMVEGGHVDGALCCVNGEWDMDKFRKAVDTWSPGGPYMAGEFYTGWLMHWDEQPGYVSAEKVVSGVKAYLDRGWSICLYMLHGGTNFGFTSGANYGKDKPLQPDITSYDYDAPISESGAATPKYYALRELISKYSGAPLPPKPDDVPLQILPRIKLDSRSDVLELLSWTDGYLCNTLPTFENLGQGYGYMLYSKDFPTGAKGILNVEGLRDYAVVYIDGKKAGELNRVTGDFSLPVDIPAGGTLSLLVENWGRINFDVKITENGKGIVSPPGIDGTPVTGSWTVRPLPMSAAPSRKDGWRFEKNSARSFTKGRPSVYRGTFRGGNCGDVFLDLTGCGKGIVFVNGHNLGRFWDVGPQNKLYLPGVWLREGRNEIVVFEQTGKSRLTGISSGEAPRYCMNPAK